MSNRLRILGWMYVALGGVGLLAGSVLCLALWLSPDVQSGDALQFIGPLFLIIAAVLLVPTLLGGIGLLYAQPWARILVIIVSALFVPIFPVGTALGGFGLWMLLAPEARRVCVKREEAAQADQRAALTSRQALRPSGRYGGLLLAMAGVGAGYIVVIATGFLLSGRPVPVAISHSFYGAMVVLSLVGWALIARRLLGRPRAVRPSSPSRWYERDRSTLRRARMQIVEERRRRLAELAADPGRRKYVPLIERGEAWSDEQIAYNEDQTKLATCVHLQPIERAMREAGIAVRYVVGLHVDAKCCIDSVELQHRFAPPESVQYIEAVVDQRSYEDPLSAWLTCTACQSLIDAVHRTEAMPQTPLFPVPASEQA